MAPTASSPSLGGGRAPSLMRVVASVLLLSSALGAAAACTSTTVISTATDFTSTSADVSNIDAATSRFAVEFHLTVTVATAAVANTTAQTLLGDLQLIATNGTLNNVARANYTTLSTASDLPEGTWMVTTPTATEWFIAASVEVPTTTIALAVLTDTAHDLPLLHSTARRSVEATLCSSADAVGTATLLSSHAHPAVAASAAVLRQANPFDGATPAIETGGNRVENAGTIAGVTVASTAALFAVICALVGISVCCGNSEEEEEDDEAVVDSDADSADSEDENDELKKAELAADGVAAAGSPMKNPDASTANEPFDESIQAGEGSMEASMLLPMASPNAAAREVMAAAAGGGDSGVVDPATKRRNAMKAQSLLTPATLVSGTYRIALAPAAADSAIASAPHAMEASMASPAGSPVRGASKSMSPSRNPHHDGDDQLVLTLNVSASTPSLQLAAPGGGDAASQHFKLQALDTHGRDVDVGSFFRMSPATSPDTCVALKGAAIGAPLRTAIDAARTMSFVHVSAADDSCTLLLAPTLNGASAGPNASAPLAIASATSCVTALDAVPGPLAPGVGMTAALFDGTVDTQSFVFERLPSASDVDTKSALLGSGAEVRLFATQHAGKPCVTVDGEFAAMKAPSDVYRDDQRFVLSAKTTVGSVTGYFLSSGRNGRVPLLPGCFKKATVAGFLFMEDATNALMVASQPNDTAKLQLGAGGALSLADDDDDDADNTAGVIVRPERTNSARTAKFPWWYRGLVLRNADPLPTAEPPARDCFISVCGLVAAMQPGARTQQATAGPCLLSAHRQMHVAQLTKSSDNRNSSMHFRMRIGGNNLGAMAVDGGALMLGNLRTAHDSAMIEQDMIAYPLHRTTCFDTFIITPASSRGTHALALQRNDGGYELTFAPVSAEMPPDLCLIQVMPRAEKALGNPSARTIAGFIGHLGVNRGLNAAPMLLAPDPGPAPRMMITAPASGLNRAAASRPLTVVQVPYNDADIARFRNGERTVDVVALVDMASGHALTVTLPPPGKALEGALPTLGLSPYEASSDCFQRFNLIQIMGQFDARLAFAVYPHADEDASSGVVPDCAVLCADATMSHFSLQLAHDWEQPTSTEPGVSPVECRVVDSTGIFRAAKVSRIKELHIGGSQSRPAAIVTPAPWELILSDAEKAAVAAAQRSARAGRILVSTVPWSLFAIFAIMVAVGFAAFFDLADSAEGTNGVIVAYDTASCNSSFTSPTPIAVAIVPANVEADSKRTCHAVQQAPAGPSSWASVACFTNGSASVVVAPSLSACLQATPQLLAVADSCHEAVPSSINTTDALGGGQFIAVDCFSADDARTILRNYDAVRVADEPVPVTIVEESVADLAAGADGMPAGVLTIAVDNVTSSSTVSPSQVYGSTHSVVGFPGVDNRGTILMAGFAATGAPTNRASFPIQTTGSSIRGTSIDVGASDDDLTVSFWVAMSGQAEGFPVIVASDLTERGVTTGGFPRNIILEDLNAALTSASKLPGRDRTDPSGFGAAGAFFAAHASARNGTVTVMYRTSGGFVYDTMTWRVRDVLARNSVAASMLFDGRPHLVTIRTSGIRHKTHFVLFVDGETSNFERGWRQCLSSNFPQAHQSPIGDAGTVRVAKQPSGSPNATVTFRSEPTMLIGAMTAGEAFVGDITFSSEILDTASVLRLALRDDLSFVDVTGYITVSSVLGAFILLAVAVNVVRNTRPKAADAEKNQENGNLSKGATGQSGGSVGKGAGKSGGSAAAGGSTSSSSAARASSAIFGRIRAVVIDVLSAVQYLDLYFSGWSWPAAFSVPISTVIFIPSFDISGIGFLDIPDLAGPLAQLVVALAVLIVGSRLLVADNKKYVARLPAVARELSGMTEKLDTRDLPSLAFDPDVLYEAELSAKPTEVDSDALMRYAAVAKIAVEEDDRVMGAIKANTCQNIVSHAGAVAVRKHAADHEPHGVTVVQKDKEKYIQVARPPDYSKPDRLTVDFKGVTHCPVHKKCRLMTATREHMARIESARAAGRLLPFECVHKLAPFNVFRPDACDLDSGFRVCRRCNFSICASCSNLSPIQTTLAIMSGVAYQFRDVSLVLGIVVVAVLEAIYVPLLKNSALILRCHPEIQCTFPGCYDEVDTSFVVAATLSSIVFVFVGFGIPFFLMRLLYERKREVLRTLCEQDVDVMGVLAIATADIPEDEWASILGTDQSMLQGMYQPFEFRYLLLPPVLLLFKMAVVSAVVFAAPGTLDQLIGVCAVQIIMQTTLTLTEPFIDAAIDSMVQVGALQQLSLLLLVSVYTLTEANEVSYAMYAVLALYTLFILSVLVRLFRKIAEGRLAARVALGPFMALRRNDKEALLAMPPATLCGVDHLGRSVLYVAASMPNRKQAMKMVHLILDVINPPENKKKCAHGDLTPGTPGFEMIRHEFNRRRTDKGEDEVKASGKDSFDDGVGTYSPVMLLLRRHLDDGTLAVRYAPEALPPSGLAHAAAAGGNAKALAAIDAWADITPADEGPIALWADPVRHRTLVIADATHVDTSNGGTDDVFFNLYEQSSETLASEPKLLAELRRIAATGNNWRVTSRLIDALDSQPSEPDAAAPDASDGPVPDAARLRLGQLRMLALAAARTKATDVLTGLLAEHRQELMRNILEENFAWLARSKAAKKGEGGSSNDDALDDDSSEYSHDDDACADDDADLSPHGFLDRLLHQAIENNDIATVTIAAELFSDPKYAEIANRVSLDDLLIRSCDERKFVSVKELASKDSNVVAFASVNDALQTKGHESAQMQALHVQAKPTCFGRASVPAVAEFTVQDFVRVIAVRIRCTRKRGTTAAIKIGLRMIDLGVIVDATIDAGSTELDVVRPLPNCDAYFAEVIGAELSDAQLATSRTQCLIGICDINDGVLSEDIGSLEVTFLTFEYLAAAAAAAGRAAGGGHQTPPATADHVAGFLAKCDYNIAAYIPNDAAFPGAERIALPSGGQGWLLATAESAQAKKKRLKQERKLAKAAKKAGGDAAAAAAKMGKGKNGGAGAFVRQSVFGTRRDQWLFPSTESFSLQRAMAEGDFTTATRILRAHPEWVTSQFRPLGDGVAFWLQTVTDARIRRFVMALAAGSAALLELTDASGQSPVEAKVVGTASDDDEDDGGYDSDGASSADDADDDDDARDGHTSVATEDRDDHGNADVNDDGAERALVDAVQDVDGTNAAVEKTTPAATRILIAASGLLRHNAILRPLFTLPVSKGDGDDVAVGKLLSWACEVRGHTLLVQLLPDLPQVPRAEVRAALAKCVENNWIIGIMVLLTVTGRGPKIGSELWSRAVSADSVSVVALLILLRVQFKPFLHDREFVFHRLRSDEMLGLLLQVDAIPRSQVDAQDIDGFTPLHRACERGVADLTLALLRQNCDWRRPTLIVSTTPEMIAAQRDHAHVVATLRQFTGAHVRGGELRDRLGRTSLMYAVMNNAKDTVEVLHQLNPALWLDKDNNGRSALMFLHDAFPPPMQPKRTPAVYIGHIAELLTATYDAAPADAVAVDAVDDAKDHHRDAAVAGVSKKHMRDVLLFPSDGDAALAQTITAFEHVLSQRLTPFLGLFETMFEDLSSPAERQRVATPSLIAAAAGLPSSSTLATLLNGLPETAGPTRKTAHFWPGTCPSESALHCAATADAAECVEWLGDNYPVLLNSRHRVLPRTATVAPGTAEEAASPEEPFAPLPVLPRTMEDPMQLALRFECAEALATMAKFPGDWCPLAPTFLRAKPAFLKALIDVAVANGAVSTALTRRDFDTGSTPMYALIVERPYALEKAELLGALLDAGCPIDAAAFAALVRRSSDSTHKKKLPAATRECFAQALTTTACLERTLRWHADELAAASDGRVQPNPLHAVARMPDAFGMKNLVEVFDALHTASAAKTATLASQTDCVLHETPLFSALANPGFSSIDAVLRLVRFTPDATLFGFTHGASGESHFDALLRCHRFRPKAFIAAVIDAMAARARQQTGPIAVADAWYGSAETGTHGDIAWPGDVHLAVPDVVHALLRGVDDGSGIVRFHGLAGGLAAVRAVFGRAGTTTKRDVDDRASKLFVNVHRAGGAQTDQEDHWVAVALPRRPEAGWGIRVNTADGGIERVSTVDGSPVADDDAEDETAMAAAGTDGMPVAWDVDVKRAGVATPSNVVERMDKYARNARR